MKGMTLVELLVAMVIMALMALAGYRGVDALLRADAQLEEHTRGTRALDLAFAAIEDDLRQAVDGPFAGSSQRLRLLRLDRQGAVRATEFRIDAGELQRRDSNLAPDALLAGIEAMSLRYLDADGNLRESWPVADRPNELPRAVIADLRIRLPGRAAESIHRFFEVRG